MPRLQSQDTAPTRLHETLFDVNAERTKARLADFFLSDEFLAPYRDDAFRYFPPAPEARRPAMGRADVYAALLNADSYLEASQDAMREGDDCGVVDALEVLAAIVVVAIGQIRGASSENRVLQ
jgi:hypothetical protein